MSLCSPFSYNSYQVGLDQILGLRQELFHVNCTGRIKQVEKSDSDISVSVLT